MRGSFIRLQWNYRTIKHISDIRMKFVDISVAIYASGCEVGHVRPTEILPLVLHWRVRMRKYEQNMSAAGRKFVVFRATIQNENWAMVLNNALIRMAETKCRPWTPPECDVCSENKRTAANLTDVAQYCYSGPFVYFATFPSWVKRVILSGVYAAETFGDFSNISNM